MKSKTPEAPGDGAEGQGMLGMSQRKDAQPELDAELQAHIGRHLKAAYEDILNQDVPDRFTQLLAQLDEAERGGSGKEPR